MFTHRRRQFLFNLLGGGGLATVAALPARGQAGRETAGPAERRIVVANGVASPEVDEAVLFPFDDASIPFTRDLYMNLVQARKFPDEIDEGLNVEIDRRQPEMPVLAQGKPGEPDSYEVICPTVYFIDGEYRMWYLGAGDDHRRRSCYAVSKDGFHWEKPKLGLVEYNGSKQNNLVDGPCGEWVLYDPDDANTERRFKCLRMIAALRLSVSYSPDGLRWKAGPEDILGIGCEAGELFKFNGCYYVNGQGGPSIMNRPIPHPIEQASKRVMVTFASYDFEHWTHAATMSFRRDNIPPRLPTDFEPHRGPQVHEGAAIWDRGNVLIGLYGQYDSPSNDRDDSRVDLGFLVSHDALHFKEPIPEFKMVSSYEERDGAAQRLVQRKAFANIGDRTVYWYSVWRNAKHPDPTGVRMATWTRDRLGFFSAAHKNQGYGASYEPHCISCPIRPGRESARIYLNAGGLGEYSSLKVELLNDRFLPMPGYSGEDCIPVQESGLRQAVSWRSGKMLEGIEGPLRVRINWGGIRPEDAKLYAVYIGQESERA